MNETNRPDPQDMIDRMVEKATRDAVAFFEDMTSHVDAAARGAKSLAEIRMLLLGLYEALPGGALVEHLAQKLVEADGIGTQSVQAEVKAEDLSLSAERHAQSEFQEARWGPGLPFEEAIDYFRDRAFTISGITKAELLSGVKDELIKAMEEGLTLGDFRKALPEIFGRHGYAMLNPWRITNIYQTSLQDAFQGGRLRQKTDAAVLSARPYWRYVAVRDMATRPTHAAMHGKVYRADHAFWQTWHPPNGFGCRCDTQTVSARELDRNKWTVETEDPTGRLFEPVDLETGARLPARPLMPDQGWDHMPGRTDLKGLLAEKLAKLRT